MLPNRRRVLSVLRALVHEFRVERVTFMAGSIAYHAFVSLLPLLLLVLAVVSSVGSTSTENGLISLTEAVLTPGASDVLVGELQRANASAGVSVLGGLLLVWGTLRIFRGLDTAFSDIYESGAANTFTDQILDGVVVLVAVGLAIVVGGFVETRLGGLGAVPGGWVVRRLLLFAGLAVVLLPMYYIFPDEDDLTVFEVVPGVLVTAGGLMVFQSLFRFYIELSSRSPRESVLAGILVFLTWLYFSGLVVLLGAVVNAVLSNRSADVDIDPVVGGIPREPMVAPSEDIRPHLRALEDTLTDAESVTVTVDGTETDLPSPASVEAGTGGSRLSLGADDAELHLAWQSSREE
jgi:membrane protein